MEENLELVNVDTVFWSVTKVGMVMGVVGFVLSCVFFLSFFGLPAGKVHDEEENLVASILILEGAASMEELSEDVLSEYYRMSRKPLEINRMTLQEMTSSGLFSHYQSVAVTDYIRRNGDILSLPELSIVDGIGQEYARALAPFISFGTESLPGKRRYGGHGTDMEFHGGSSLRYRTSGIADYSYRARYGLVCGSRMEFRISSKRNYGAEQWFPSEYGFSAALYGRKFLSKLIVGDFNARFGQGLTLWNGFSLSGVPLPSSFSKRASGISPSGSYSSGMAFRGMSAEIKLGSFTVSPLIVLTSFEDYVWNMDSQVIPAGNVSWYGDIGQFSFTLSGKDNLSADARVCIKGVDLFTEIAYDTDSSALASLAGSVFSIGEKMKMGMALRYYPYTFHSGYSSAMRSGTKCSNEHGLSLSGSVNSSERISREGESPYNMAVSRHALSFSVDNVYNPEAKGAGEYGKKKYSFQSRIVFNDEYWFTPSIGLKTRMTSRFRTYFPKVKSDMRLQLEWRRMIWRSSIRLHLLYSEAFSALCYAEAGAVSGSLKAFVRVGMFHADNWNDRIYVYERDAPGNFSSPAFYGRGVWTSIYCTYSPCDRLRLYLRAACTAYAGHEKKKPGQAELKLHFIISLPES